MFKMTQYSTGNILWNNVCLKFVLILVGPYKAKFVNKIHHMTIFFAQLFDYKNFQACFYGKTIRIWI
jgi:hypothetical protein